MDDGVFEDGFAGAGFAEDEAEPALLAVDLENVEVALLVFEERGVFVDDEGVVAETEVASDHGGGGVWWLDWMAFAMGMARASTIRHSAGTAKPPVM